MLARLKQALRRKGNPGDGPLIAAAATAALSPEADIRRLREQGYGRRRIARELGLTEYAVRKIEEAAAAEGRPIQRGP